MIKMLHSSEIAKSTPVLDNLLELLSDPDVKTKITRDMIEEVTMETRRAQRELDAEGKISKNTVDELNRLYNEYDRNKVRKLNTKL